MNIKQVNIYNINPTFSQLEKLSELLECSVIKNNGYLVAKCNISRNKDCLKADIAELLNLRKSKVNLTYTENEL